MKNLLTFLLLAIAVSSYGQCYEIKANYTGLNLYNSDLFSTYCEAVNLIKDMSFEVGGDTAAFKVIEYDLYPMGLYQNGNLEIQKQQEGAEDYMNTLDHPYLGIVKHIDEGKIIYKVLLRLPDTGKFANVNAITEKAISENIKNEMESSYAIHPHNPDAEINGLSLLINYLHEIEDTTFSIDEYEDSGFHRIPLPEDMIIASQGHATNTGANGINHIIDEADLYLNGESLALALGSLNERTTDVSLDYLWQITSNYNQDFDTYNQTFEESNRKVKFWIHIEYGDGTPIDEPTLLGEETASVRSNNAPILYVKVDNNMTLAESNKILEETCTPIYEECTADPPELSEANCSPSLKMGFNCLLPKIEENLPEGNTYGVGEVLMYNGGVAAGLIDGLLGTIEFMYKASGAVVSTIIKDGIKIALGGTIVDVLGILKEAYINSESMINNIKQNVLDAGIWLYKNWDLIQEVYEITVEAFKDFASNPEAVKRLTMDVAKGFIDWIGPLLQEYIVKNSVDIAKMVGYGVGIIGFEIVVAYFTAGASTSAALSKSCVKIMEFVKHIKNSTTKLSGWLFTSLKEGAKTAKGAALALKCRLITGPGCFVKDTPVLMAHNPFKNVATGMALAAMPLVAPIQDVQVDDMVKAYHHEEMYLTASNDVDDIYVPGWQDYDYLDITPETWQVGKFVIKEEDGDLVEIEANRPKKWFESLGVEKIGNTTFLVMEEFGVYGNAELLELKPTIIDTRNFKLNESEKVDRPIITTFKRVANEISDYTFSNGQVISCTPNHPLYSSDRKAYLPIGELTFGERVQTSGDKEVKFIGGKSREKGEHVYNFEVWREHNYFVGFEEGDDFVLAHNICKWILRIKNKYPNDPIPNGKSFDFTVNNGKMDITNHQGRTEFDFIIDGDGKLKIGDKHLFLSQKADVQAAGQMKVVNGNVRRIDNQSGHYQPDADQAELFEHFFRSGNGLTLTGGALEVFGINSSGQWAKLYQRFLD